MRKLISLQKLIDQAREDDIDPRDLAVDEDEIFDLDELDNELEDNPSDDDDKE